MLIRKSGLRTLSCCCFVLCLLAVNAGSAHAEKGANWKLKGAQVTTGLLPSVAATFDQTLTLVSQVTSIKVEVRCTGVVLEGFKLQVEGSIASGAKAKLTGCTTSLNNINQVSCEPKTGTEKGVIITTGLKGLLILHESRRIVQLEPAAGESLATITSTSECLVGKEVSVLGKVTLSDLNLETEASTHLLVAGPLTEMWLVSKTEEHKATPGGSVSTELSGEHKGLSWSSEEVGAGTGHWDVNGSSVSTKLLPLLQAQLEEKGATLLTTVAGVKVDTSCTGIELLETKLEAEGKFKGKAKFTSCVLKLNGTIAPVCEPLSGGEAGVIRTKLLKGSLALHSGEGILRIAPAEGTALAVYEFGEECSAMPTYTVGGELTLKDAKMSSEAVSHLGVEGPLTALWAISNTAEHKATVDGGVTGFLSGAEHKGLAWSGHPG